MSSKKNDSVSLIISNPKVLDCSNCFQLLTTPLFQCDNGHIVCSTCFDKLGNKCHKCSFHISSKRCKAIENILQSMEMSCPNEKHGCRETISYIGNRKHEEECIHQPCYCPILGCDFIASSEVLSNHFSHKHGDSRIKFAYGRSFTVTLNSSDETIVLQEENGGKLFILKNSTMLLGNAVNILCIGPNSSESEYSYDILARSQTCKLELQACAKNVQRVTSEIHSSEFLLIPFDSSKPLKIQIYKIPMMQIFIKTMDQMVIPLRVKSSDTVDNVKEMIFDKGKFRVNDQRLIFSGKQLEDFETLAHYNIQEKATIHLVLRIIGD